MTNSPADPIARPTADLTAQRLPHGWRWAPAWVLAYVALWPAPGIAEAVLVLGALLAAAMLAVTRFRQGPALLSSPAWALTTALFFAYWLPQLLSSFDAVDMAETWAKSAKGLRYLPFLWLVAMAVANERGRRVTFTGLAVIVTMWTLDAWAQALSGTSPLFWCIDRLKWAISDRGLCSAEEIAVVDRLSGFLGPCNLKLGQVMASLSPFALFAASRRFGITGWLLAATAIGVVIVLAGSRAAWITYALVLAFTGLRLLGWKKMLSVAAACVMALVVLSALSPQVQERFRRTTMVLQADSGAVDSALSGRARIWSAAWCMVREHPFNGVGVRSFRDAFPQCDPQHGSDAAWGEGPALHAHQIVMEILSETGVIGLLLWLAGAALAWRAWWYAGDATKERARPAMLALAVTVFPFNTHLAFYSSFWGGVTLLLAGLYVGSLLAREDDGADS